MTFSWLSHSLISTVKPSFPQKMIRNKAVMVDGGSGLFRRFSSAIYIRTKPVLRAPSTRRSVPSTWAAICLTYHTPYCCSNYRSEDRSLVKVDHVTSTSEEPTEDVGEPAKNQRSISRSDASSSDYRSELIPNEDLISDLQVQNEREDLGELAHSFVRSCLSCGKFWESELIYNKF